MTVAENDIIATACADCEFRSITEIPVCPRCGALTQKRSTAKTGTVWSHTLVHLPFEDWRDGYRLIYVDLDDGPRILADQRPVGPEPDIGARVTVCPTTSQRFAIGETFEL